MDMSAMSMNLSSIMQAVNITMTRKAMNADAQAVSDLLVQMEAANPPPVEFGHQFYEHV